MEVVHYSPVFISTNWQLRVNNLDTLVIYRLINSSIKMFS